MPAYLDPVAYFNANYKIDPKTGCWNWTGSITTAGYGDFHHPAVNGGTNCNASRAAWLLFRGPLKKGYNGEFACHTCDNKRCVCPDHLFSGTGKENMRDCVAKGRINRGVERPQAKLTEADVHELRILRQKGWSWDKLMLRYGVTKNCVRSAALGQTWMHVMTPIPTVKFGSGRRPNG